MSGTAVISQNAPRVMGLTANSRPMLQLFVQELPDIGAELLARDEAVAVNPFGARLQA